MSKSIKILYFYFSATENPDDSDFEPPSPESNNHDSDDEAPIAPKGKRSTRLNVTDSEDSDFENKASNKVKGRTNNLSLKKKLQEYGPKQSSKYHSRAKTKPSSKNSAIQSINSNPENQGATADEGNLTYSKLEWLQPENIMDAEKRRPDHPDYDQRTLFVPPEFLDKQTPLLRQWWEMKASHYDCVLFFKIGRWYVLFHMDTAIGVNELGLSYMNQGAHTSFVESGYPRMAAALVYKGYKVARIEQTETPEIVLERCKKMGSSCTKWDKIIIREICQVEVKGALVSNLISGDPTEPDASYMMAIVEEEGTECSKFGVCFLDASIGVFHLGQFEDDKHCSRLLTMLAHHPPALVIYDRKTISPRVSKLLSTHCHNARREPHPIWPPEKTLQTLKEKYYKTRDWPEGIKPFLNEGDALTPAAHCSLAIKALGGCVSYLTDCLLDIQILGMAQFEPYAPPDALNQTLSQEDKVDNRWKGGSTMVLDAITLRNLRIVQDEGCLYERMNFCSTAMGKRRLYQWICAPSCDLEVIKERQEAVKTLLEKQELCQEAKNILTTLPDLERLLAKVHALGNLQRSKLHPDARAIFYKEKFSKQKVLDFIAVLNGFSAALKLIELFRDEETVLLKRITHFNPDGKFPDMRNTLKFFKEAFNQKEAAKEGFILPDEGVDQEYDSTLQLISDIDMELKRYLDQQEKHFKCFLSYMGSEKRRYHIKVPEKAASRAGPDYTLEGSGKGFKRYSTAETKELLARMMAAEEQKTTVLNDISRRIFEKFSSTYELWMTAVKCISTLDILLSFTEFAQHHQQNGDICLPEVTFNKDKRPYINITEGRHPCIPVVDEFISNDTRLGVDGASLLLLTGPNMGGKSTLMRQVGLLTVLAQLGSYVPAQACSLSLVDRIFTRLGASDDILSGQSTFLVEMSETAAIVRHASEHSLVLLDELGRGTSTYDGTALASGVCAELAARGPRCVFSTHYHALVQHFAQHEGVALGHMACKVETDESTADSEDHIPEETITFLYKLSPGACPKSYGFNAARLAGVPRDITACAHTVSRRLEAEASRLRAFRDLMKMDDVCNMRQLLSSLSL
ncbi:hypothetical protein ABMA28_008234 [Loxostege sticticalis]|uniref:DNA mismatch repair proteins mutS family domain-containing protein n=1 Tax=Loxostege sticticalis TaxID=481309 RepID=A0ABD0SHD4_LOXSC